MLKSDARKYYRNLRKQFSKDEVAKMSNQIFEKIKQFNFSEDQTFHIFLPIDKNNEIITYPIIQWLQENGKTIVLPLVIENDMINCKVEPGFTTRLSPLQIPEPTDYMEITSDKIDVVFVPMFVTDRQGNRVGYGGGYYDKFLARCRPETKKIGLTYFRPIDSIDDAYKGDIALDYLITPEEMVSF
ncbi:5-formyltetrahydrofolate cyclo-ligase [Faecalibacter rhinopitheci]|uniref:5-formyltetrahydrofolate cyclo-ligase n=1 Tax=Faecalibacter rhinopitheci TaxID=2779678 RepID=A0A8J7K4S5_9FLAO|nr:5-formyltetrahydrofolate cyclo-ligase [Faecalibacter rhinopitheci]MBF0597773.1 5-formyltetrahydrofolate cyclo-ligase [Faecalibacter rhinopitheci]